MVHLSSQNTLSLNWINHMVPICYTVRENGKYEKLFDANYMNGLFCSSCDLLIFMNVHQFNYC